MLEVACRVGEVLSKCRQVVGVEGSFSAGEAVWTETSVGGSCLRRHRVRSEWGPEGCLP